MGDTTSPDKPLPTRTEAGEETVDLPEGLGFFSTGQVLGERYEILEMLGRGGMGVVWRAFDLKLRVEVGLKALREELFQSERRLELLRQEVRAAREVVSPNVCRIFDLIEIDGRELVSMEYVDGATLLGVLQERGPLELKEAQDIASQFLSGLEAIHKAGLVHRDVKPENIMLTRAGRVVVMDFGLARGPESGAGSVSGTPAYMAPEHAAGSDVDARADVYSAGVVLAEMVSPDGVKSYESRQSVWEGVRSEPAQVPDSPWAPVIKRAVARDRERRQNSAHTLIRELEDVTLRVKGAEDLHPYPGLASFTEEDAEYFFGREAEVEQMWRKLEGPPRMLGIMGPSGAGKTSFIRAGVIPNAQSSWAIIRCTPGSAAIPSLRGALTSELAGRTEALQGLVTDPDNPDVVVDAVASWRHGRNGALLIVDQFEELFTLSSKEEQNRYAALLGRLPLETDVHVVVSMRDDFAASCNAHEALRPVFHELTVLDPPTGGSLRRALVQPATKCGYRFEDDDLVEEILDEVEGERGTLPLLAFALTRLWDKRDRESGLLTRQAYHDIGGVGGALARHAEATVDRVGVERIPIVRELFRNLVTAEGTRAVREWDDLLSVFEGKGGERTKPSPTNRRGDGNVGAGFTPARDAAAEVLAELIDARLLTSYEVREDEHEPIRRVEIIHESLLASWPRLVRWQTQDQEGAQLRDELRQGAQVWNEHDRSDGRLWTGTAYREFRLWQERYTGGLTEVEEAFASAMTSFAGRRRRRRRLIVAAVMAALIVGLAIVGSFWQRSVRETRRAEAQKLIAHGQLELDSYPTSAVAHAIASLELADGLGARRLALEALWTGPTALIATEEFARMSSFSPDGRWLVHAEDINADRDRGHLSIFSADGSSESLEHTHLEATVVRLSAISDTGHFVSRGPGADSTLEHVLWSMPEGRRLADIRYKEPAYTLGIAGDENRDRHLLLVVENNRAVVDALGHNGSVERLGTLEFEYSTGREWYRNVALDPQHGRWLAAVVKNEILVLEIGKDRISEPRRLGRVNHAVVDVVVDPLGRFVATADAEGEIRLWSLTEESSAVDLQGPPDIRFLRMTPDGSLFETAVQDEGNWITWVWDLSGNSPRFLRRFDLGGTGWGGWYWDTVGRQVARWGPDMEKVSIWSMDAPPDAEPLMLNRGDNQQMNSISFNPRGGWLATSDMAGFAVWPVARRYPTVIQPQSGQMRGLAFDPVGRWLVASTHEGVVKLWPLEGDPLPKGRTLGFGNVALAVSPDGDRILAGAQGGDGVNLFFPDGRPFANLPRPVGEIWSVAFTPDGRYAAGVGGQFNPEERVIVVWDMASEEVVKVLDVGERPGVGDLQFTGDGSLLSMSESGLYRWNVETGERELLYSGDIFRFSSDASGRHVVVLKREDASDLWGEAFLLDVDSGDARHFEEFGEDVASVAIDPTGTFGVTGHRDGEVRVGKLNGDEPHLLLGHETAVTLVAIDPLGRWVASGSDDETIRLWPMPDLSKPPLHILPPEELIAKLKTLTNLRVVRDPESSTGWKLTHDPFPGWETVPTW